MVVALTATGCGIDWRESYAYDDEDPFDLYVLHELLKARPAGLEVLPDSLPQLTLDSSGTANYVFVGNYAYYDERNITHLLDFVERGNTAFIAAYELPEELAEHLYGPDCIYNYDDGIGATNQYNPYNNQYPYVNVDTVLMSLAGSDSSYQLVNVYNWKPTPTAHAYVADYYLCDPEIDNEAIGQIDTTYVNFVRLKWGEGNFYFNTNPKYFTNYYLVDSVQHAYARDAMAVLAGGPVYWDEASRIPPDVARQRRQASNPRRTLRGRNLLSGNEALSYIQNQPELALAWYLLVVAALLYILFRGKRRQRIIPVIKQRENSSRRFIDTLSRLVFQRGNHAALARQELSNLKFFLLNRFNLRWNPADPLPADFGELTGANPAVIERADIEIDLVNSKSDIGESDLVRFYRGIEPLYDL